MLFGLGQVIENVYSQLAIFLSRLKTRVALRVYSIKLESHGCQLFSISVHLRNSFWLKLKTFHRN